MKKEDEELLILTRDQLDDLIEKSASRSAEIMLEWIYQKTGRSILNKLVWVIFTLGIFVVVWFQSKGIR